MRINKGGLVYSALPFSSDGVVNRFIPAIKLIGALCLPPNTDGN